MRIYLYENCLRQKVFLATKEKDRERNRTEKERRRNREKSEEEQKRYGKRNGKKTERE